MKTQDNIECYIQDAISLVDSWSLPEEDFAQAVNEQAKLMAGLGLEPNPEITVDCPYSALRF